jgi:small subunit ribosomal protein S16
LDRVFVEISVPCYDHATHLSSGHVTVTGLSFQLAAACWRGSIMPVRLRLSLHGNRNNRIFHLIAIDARKRRDAKPIELLGIYNPRLRLGHQEQEHKTMHWSVERITYWLQRGGALPSKSVVKLLEWVRHATSIPSYSYFFLSFFLCCVLKQANWY